VRDLRTASITGTARRAGRRPGILSLPVQNAPEGFAACPPAIWLRQPCPCGRAGNIRAVPGMGVRIRGHNCHDANDRVSLYALLGLFRHTMICPAAAAQPGETGVTAEVAAG